MLLIKAEALARQNDLVGAVDTYNLIRERAGRAPHVLGQDVTTQADVLAAVDLERQLELAFEGDRWPDLVRTGRAVELLGIPEFQALYPIPQTELDVAPGITQNPGLSWPGVEVAWRGSRLSRDEWISGRDHGGRGARVSHAPRLP